MWWNGQKPTSNRGVNGSNGKDTKKETKKDNKSCCRPKKDSNGKAKVTNATSKATIAEARAVAAALK